MRGDAAWITTTLGAVATPSKKKVDPAKALGVPYIGLEHVEAQTMTLTGCGIADDVKSIKATFRAGDVLYGRLRPYLNKVAQPDFDGIASTDFLVFEASSLKVDAKYFAYYLNQPWVADEANHMSSGVELPRVSWQSLADLPFAYPSDSAVQRAVVERVDSARKTARDAVTYIESATAVTETLRAAVFSAASSGRLTEAWRSKRPDKAPDPRLTLEQAPSKKLRRGVDPSLPPADVLTTPAPPGWTAMTVAQLLAADVLQDVKDGNHGGNHPKVSEFTPVGLPFITANCVRDGAIDYVKAPRVSGLILERLKVGFSQPGDVVLTHKGTVGRVAIATQHAVLTPQTTYYRCDKRSLLPEYLALFLGSSYFYLQLAAVMSQTTRDFVPISEQYRLTIVIPPLDEQAEVVRIAENVLKVTGRIQDHIQKARLAARRTTDAVAEKAFRGELRAGV